MRQQVEATVKLTLSMDASLHMEEIGVYVREGLYAGFEDQAEFVDGNTMVDILDIKEEAEIYGNENPETSTLMTEVKIKWALDYSENVNGMASVDNYARLPQAEAIVRSAARMWLDASRGCYGTLMPQIPPAEALTVVSRDTYNKLLRNTPRNPILPEQGDTN